jgi:hypothetical protein
MPRVTTRWCRVALLIPEVLAQSASAFLSPPTSYITLEVRGGGSFLSVSTAGTAAFCAKASLAKRLGTISIMRLPTSVFFVRAYTFSVIEVDA